LSRPGGPATPGVARLPVVPPAGGSTYFFPMRPRFLAVLLFAGANAAVSAPLAAQAPPHSTLYLPVASWTTPYVEHLIRAGVLRGLDPLSRPLRRADVARAVLAADTAELGAPVRGTLRLLARELAERPDTVRWKLEADVAVQAASDAGRWALRPADQAPRLFVDGGLEASLEFPHVAIVSHPYLDTRLRRDGAFYGKKDRFTAGYNADAYVLGSWRYLDVFFGIEPRNWGPPEVEGLLLSTSPYPYDHLFVRLGPRRLRVELVAAQLNDLPAWDSAFIAKRFLSVHRLVVLPSDRLAIALSEASLYADLGGPSRGFEPWYLNPVNLWYVASSNGVAQQNALWAADVSWQLRGGTRLAAQFFADDIQVDRKTLHDHKPEELGWTLSATGGWRRGAASWSAFYTRVDALDYRTENNQEQYSVRGLGLARNHSDYDQLTARATVAAAPRALVSGEVTVLRQGQGDFRLRYPPDSAFADSLILFTGTVERTVRLAAQAAWTPVPDVNLSADVGLHIITNAGHVAGAHGNRWVWRVRAEIRRRVSGGIDW
jgi:hypothetical protein